ncbi:non-ribosomal peptide synthetase [Nocardia cyriacigeorgica]|uniref:Dimodular nonribosomal peptide synthase n=1 Tax=Nocardia cyriacigeorgica TaxID=135487 RepID=A0A4V6ICL6_9NOCA|nr:non-ribosomal peptide synthetase [Nocardia cyriacigeorgica]VFA99403.1 Dimodular nonribosomal peptide synthase [Nocardia cyriacigeorgica]
MPASTRRWPLTVAQQEIWAGTVRDETGRRFLVGGYVHLHGRIDAEVFERALRSAVAGSETLRAGVDLSGSHPCQVVHDCTEWVLHRRDFTEAADRLAAVRAFIDAEFERPYDLSRPPLFDHYLLDLGAEGYVWFLRAHHLIFDGGASLALIRRVARTYGDLLAGGTAPTTVFDTMSALVEGDHRYRASRRFADDRAFWGERLAGAGDAPTFAQAPIAPHRPAPIRHRGDLSAERWRAFRDGAARYGVGWPALFAATTAALLHADTGARSVVLGLTVPAKRSWHALGMTSNIVPLRIPVDPAAPLGDLAATAQAEFRTVLRHQHYRRFDMLADGLVAGGERRMAGPTLNIMPMPHDITFGAVTATLHEVAPGHTDGFSIGVYDNGSPTLRIDFDTSSDRWSPGELAAHHARYLSALEAVAAAPAELPLARLRYSDHIRATHASAEAAPTSSGLIASDEHGIDARTPCPRRAAPPSGEQTAPAPGNDGPAGTIAEWFARSALAAGDSVAVTHGDETLTYAELDRRAGALARAIAGHGVGAGDFVVVAVPRSVELVVAIVAVVKSGAAYVPLEPAQPAERTTAILADAEPALLITTPETTIRSDRLPVLLIGPGPVMDGAGRPDGSPDAEPLHPSIRPADPAYVIYTSGSTGAPKGVVVTHANVVRLFTATQPWFEFGHDDVWTLLHSIAFDFSVWEMWGALLYGGRLVVVDADTARAPADFVELLIRERVTVLNQTPSAFGLLAATARADTEFAVRVLIFSGEALPPAALGDWPSRYPRQRLVNMYGATETTVLTTAHVLGSAPDGEALGGIIGDPIADLRCYVLDSALRPVADGIPGELYISGPGVAAGYLRRPGLTAARFVADPFGPPGAVMYRSGDRARRTTAGLEYLGRADRQVKIRGYRIEPGEVEAALARQPGVSAAAVVPEELAGIGVRLVGYVVTSETDTAQIRAALTDLLPQQSIPALLVAIRELPLTGNGKVDHRALRAIRTGLDAAGDAEPPRTEREEALLEAFVTAVGHTGFGVTDEFFAVGGDSILAIRVVDLAREQGLVISTKDVFTHRTVRALAAVAQTVPAPVIAPASRPIEIPGDERDRLVRRFGPIADLLPVTPLQTGLLFHSTLADSAEDPYVVQLHLMMRGDLRPDRLRAAARTVIERHPQLGGAFSVGEQPVFVVPELREPRWYSVDLGADQPRTRAEKIESITDRDRRGIDLAVPPLLAFSLVGSGEQQWRLILTVHHALVDGWSLGLLLRELFLAYQGVELPAPQPYRRFLDQLAARPVAPARRAWRRVLEGAEPCLVGRASAPQGEAITRTARVPDDVTTALTARAAERGLTTNSVIQAIWALQLAALTGNTDIVFGIAVSGRADGVDTSATIGMLLNTVPVRIRLCPAETGYDLAARIQAQRTELLDHDHLGLGEILGTRRAGALFDAALAFENHPIDTAALLGTDLTVTAIDSRDRTHYPLALTVYPVGGLVLRLTVRPESLIAQTTADEIMAAILATCAGLAQAPDNAVAGLPAASPEVLARTRAFGRGPAVPTDERPLGAVFAAMAAAGPDRPALWWAGAEISYRDLSARANRLAHRLAEQHDVRLGTCVGLRLPRSPELVVAILALAELGAICVPLHEQDPPGRVAHIVERTGVTVLLDDLDELRAMERAAAGYSPDRPGCLVPADSTAWLMFTSGSTGVPKGTRITHRGIVARCLDATASGPEHERILLHSPYTWDSVVTELWRPLLTGHCAVVAPAGPMAAPDFRAVLAAGAVTSLFLSAGLLTALADQLADSFAELRMLASAGDVMVPAAVRAARAVDADLPVVNTYGPVEATTFATTHAVAAGPLGDTPVPIGRPVDNTEVWVLDPLLRPAPPGVTGEIYLSGAGLADGYHDLRATTAARFVANPFGAMGSRMYRTGDRGSWGGDGVLRFAGRGDRQVKVNGIRVEPGEIEAALQREPGVTAAVVIARRTGTGTTLAGYVVAEADIDPVAVRARLATTLPGYLVPATVIRLPSLPLTVNGKVDRTALPMPAVTMADTARTPRQELLAGHFTTVLGIPEIGIEDDFFGIGGNSLAAIRLVGAVSRELGVTVTLRDLFEAPTIAALDRRLDGRRARTDRTPPPIRFEPRPPTLPLSPAQQRFWTINYLSEGRADYLMAAALELRGGLDATALRTAIGDVVCRHEVLRTVLPYGPSGPAQQIQQFHPDAVDFRSVELADDAAVDRELATEAGTGFRLLSQAPCRARLYRLGPRRHVLLVVLHHSAGDGESMVALFRDIEFAYQARTGGHEPAWPAPAVQYADYTLWLRDRMGTEADPDSPMSAQARYWRARLADLPTHPPLPVDHARTAGPQSRAAAVPIDLTAQQHARLAETARGCGASTYMALHAALVCGLTGMGTGTDLVIGTALSGRDTAELDTLLGCAVHTVLIRTDTASAPTFRDLIRQVRDRVLEATEHKEYPFDRLMAELNPAGAPTHHPIPQIATTFVRETLPATAFDGIDLTLRPVLPQHTEFEVLVSLREVLTGDGEPAGIRGHLVYAADLWEPATMSALVDRIHGAVAALTADVDRTLGSQLAGRN